MKIRLIRHATLQLWYGGCEILLDPMFSPKGTFSSLTVGSTSCRNPMVDLPCSIEEIEHPDVTFITHAHFDHIDRHAAESRVSGSPVVCHSSSFEALRKLGLKQLVPVLDKLDYKGINIHRIGGRHGSGLLGKLMGKVSGFMLNATNEPTVYIAGDTIWCGAVAEAIMRYNPSFIIANCGAARFNVGAPITMGTNDIGQMRVASPQSTIIAVHMDAINHCRLTREQFTTEIKQAGIVDRIKVPFDGEKMEFSSGTA